MTYLFALLSITFFVLWRLEVAVKKDYKKFYANACDDVKFWINLYNQDIKNNKP